MASDTVPTAKSPVLRVREAAGETQEAMQGRLNAAAKAAGVKPVTRAAVSGWERGAFGMSRPRRALFAAVYYGEMLEAGVTALDLRLMGDEEGEPMAGVG